MFGWITGQYRFTRYKSEDKAQGPRVLLTTAVKAIEPALAEAAAPLRPTVRRGVGLASCWYGCGNTSLPNPSTIRIGLTAQGRLVLHQGATDIGQGANTVITQIAAEALGLPVACFELVGPDTALSPDAGKTSASRQTFVSGKAAEIAGRDLRGKLLHHVRDRPFCRVL